MVYTKYPSVKGNLVLDLVTQVRSSDNATYMLGGTVTVPAGVTISPGYLTRTKYTRQIRQLSENKHISSQRNPGTIQWLDLFRKNRTFTQPLSYIDGAKFTQS